MRLIIGTAFVSVGCVMIGAQMNSADFGKFVIGMWAGWFVTSGMHTLFDRTK